MSHKSKGFGLAESVFIFIFQKIAFKIAIFTVFEDDVKMFSAPEAVVHFDDEGRGERFESSDLAFDLFFNMIGQLVDIDAFDCHFNSIFALPIEDLSAGSFSQRMGLEDAIVGYLFHNSLAHYYK